jgi:hypothetical protein
MAKLDQSILEAYKVGKQKEDLPILSQLGSSSQPTESPYDALIELVHEAEEADLVVFLKPRFEAGTLPRFLQALYEVFVMYREEGME